MARRLPLFLTVVDLDVWSEWEGKVRGCRWDFEWEKMLRESLPLYRYSATFLAALQTNIRLSNTSAMSLSTSAPPEEDTNPLIPESEPPPIPPLTTHIAISTPQKIDALKLVADSVAQQRQTASYALITHPLPLSFAFLLLALISQYVDLPMLFTTGAGVIMSLLVAVRGLTGGYLVHAEKIGWAWLGEGEDGDAGKGKKKGDEVVVVVSEWGEKIIGTLVLRLVKKERRAYVKAWTTGLKYRGKGIGRGLLEEGVRVAADRGCRAVEFDDDHANSKRILPSLFNRGFERREALARKTLADVAAEQRRLKG